MSDEQSAVEHAKARKLSTHERLERVERALTEGLRVDLSQYDLAVLHAERETWAEESGVADVERARTEELETAAKVAAEEEAAAAAAAAEPAPAPEPATS